MRKFFSKLFRYFIILFIASIAYCFLCKWIMPPITITQLAAIVDGYGMHRDYVPLEKISPNVRVAAIAGEDQLFALHSGFDWMSLSKSMEAKNVKKDRLRGSAASTISQQTAKNIFLWQGSGIWKYIRKIPEFFYTWLIEKIWGKRRILEVYLNVAETGKGVFGVEAAAQKYFGKPAAKLSKKEAAMLIASFQNPKVFTIIPMSSHVNWKSEWIIKQMNNIGNDRDIRFLLTDQ